MNFSEALDDACLSHTGSDVWRFAFTFWRFRIELDLMRIEAAEVPNGPRGYELGVHLWRV